MKSKKCKRAYVSFFLLLLFIVVSLINSNGYTQVDHSIRFNKADLSITSAIAKDKVTYEKLAISGCINIDEPGAPSLPVKYIRLIIPTETDVESIDITRQLSEKIYLSHLILPAQPPVPASIDYIEPDFVEPDPEIYQSSQKYPGTLVKVINHEYFDRSTRLVTLAVYPCQY